MAEGSAAIEQTVDDQPTQVRIDKLRERIKNTSSIRFAASKRVRFNYSVANLTIVVLSLWAITISFVLTARFIQIPDTTRTALETTGVILPVFIVVFSLIEGGANFLRGHQLEANARQLRELADLLTGEVAKISHIHDNQTRAELFERFSTRYNDCLERSPINHDDIDYYSKHYALERSKYKITSAKWWVYELIVVGCFLRRQVQRVVYVSLWFIPILAFSSWPAALLIHNLQGPGSHLLAR